MGIELFIPNKTNESILNKYIDFNIEFQREVNPDDPPAPPELIRKAILEDSSQEEIFRWIVFSELKEILGYARLSYPNKKSPMFETNKSIADITIIVTKEFRRKKIGSELLKVLVDKAKELGKKTFQTVTNLESGRKFIEHFGGIIAADRSRNRLYYREIKWKEMEKWCEEGKERAKGVRIETFQDVPEEDIEEFTKIYTITENQAPDYESGDYQGLKVTPESRRYYEQFYTEKGYTWITKITREEDGTICGLTEIFYNKHMPHMIEQEMTGVLPKYRGRGLGKWLKADMFLYIKENYPKIDYIETGNANNNLPMLAINKKMGYKKHMSEYLMKIEIKKIEEKL
ncbi:MAG: GNAT family N-acetyltransferase [Asgard group archaeon]|nr:GNAT family N-acetyltransferase [Asgard group archaeon]